MTSTMITMMTIVPRPIYMVSFSLRRLRTGL
jgi:hypothetical protein